MAQRKLASWIGAFTDYTERLPSPLLFRKWAGITAIAGALELRVYTHSSYGTTYPNMYTVLVGPPGVGKTVVSSVVQGLWDSLCDGTPSGHFVAPTNATKAALIDALKDAERKVVDPAYDPPVETFNSMKICANELSTLMPAYDSELMGALTDIWDHKPYTVRRVSRDLNYRIERPQINLLAGTTPAYLLSTMPESAWDGGFLSRTMLIFSSETIIRPLFGNALSAERDYSDLANDIGIIAELRGKMEFTEEAASCVAEWHNDGGPPQPEHPRLMHYTTRRTQHLLKLCMIAAASDNNGSLEITLDNVQTALDWLIEAETFLPDIFKAIAKGGDSQAIEDCWHFAYQTWIKEKKPILEHRLVAYLQERVPAHSVMRIIDVMVRGKLLEKQIEGYVPKKPRSN